MGKSGEDFDTKNHEDPDVNFVILRVMLEQSCYFNLMRLASVFCAGKLSIAMLRLRRSVCDIPLERMSLQSGRGPVKGPKANTD